MGTMNPNSSELVYQRKAWPGTALVWSTASRLGNGGETVRMATVSGSWTSDAGAHNASLTSQPSVRVAS